jgi:hypothetical protein
MADTCENLLKNMSEGIGSNVNGSIAVNVFKIESMLEATHNEDLGFDVKRIATAVEFIAKNLNSDFKSYSGD